MNDDKPSDSPHVTEADATPPDPSNSGGWKMPEPKFQQSSGYLPQGYLEQAGFSGVAQAAAPAAEMPSTPSADVEAQPDINEQINDAPSVTAPAPVVKKRSPAVRVTLIVLGLLAMVGFIAVFLAVIYFLFLAPSGSSPF